MCGIIGYTGDSPAAEKITAGLSVLEYRGYDSVGIAVFGKDGVSVVKRKGRVAALAAALEVTPLPGTCGIGHTRWATHGVPSDRNAHPHRSGRVTLVHNGIIENHKEHKERLAARGVRFFSETDTEVAAALIDEAYGETQDARGAIRLAAARMTGTFAFAVLFDDAPGKIYAARRGSPLLVARGKEGFYLASDMTALLPFTREYRVLEEGEIACLSPGGITLWGENGNEKTIAFQTTAMTPEAAMKGGFSHFMEKEIHEEADALLSSLRGRIRGGLPDFSAEGLTEDFFRTVKRVRLVACGSAMHAGLIGARLLTEFAGIPATVHIASEYRYFPPAAEEGTLVLVISQSGETADTLAALRLAAAEGIPTLAIVNAPETTIAREADHTLYTFAGPEIAVATTKGYLTQVSLLYLFSLAFATVTGKTSEAAVRKFCEELLTDVPTAIRETIAKRDRIRKIAKNICQNGHLFYIGRGIDYALAMEASLKLKEISYLHAEAYAAGELKHGTISLVEEGTPVIALLTESSVAAKTASNLAEVESRGGRVIAIGRADLLPVGTSLNLPIPANSHAGVLFGTVVAVQLLAYEVATARGCDVDKPRNLAKSVTVE